VTAARRTAVTDGKPPSTQTLEKNAAAKGEVSTGLFRKIDVDGLSRLEEVDVATRVAAPRARRQSSQGEVMPGDTDVHALYDMAQDKDRHTEVGGPPTGQVPKLGASAEKLPAAVDDKRSITQTLPGKRGLWLLFALLAAGAIAIGIYLATRGPAEPVVAVADARSTIDPQDGSLTIDPAQEGASGYIELVGDTKQRKPIPRLTHAAPFKATLRANEKYHFHLELAGYLPYDETVTITPGAITVVNPRLLPAPAKLHVVTDPDGVQVILAGRSLGDSGKTFDNLTPGKGLELVLSKPSYASITKAIDLVAGETTEIKETLRAIEKFGFVTITVQQPDGKPTWGEVFHNGRGLGRNQGLGPPTPLKLPVGRQPMVIKNPSFKAKTVTVNVTEGTTPITVRFDN
jgi:hypothetical protein